MKSKTLQTSLLAVGLLRAQWLPGSLLFHSSQPDVFKCDLISSTYSQHKLSSYQFNKMLTLVQLSNLAK